MAFLSLFFMCDKEDIDEVPLDFLCPLTNEIMKNPYLMEDGYTYEKKNIDDLLKENEGKSPLTGKKISKVGTKNIKLLQRINTFLDEVKNKTINIIVAKLEGGHLNFIMKKNDTVLQLKQNIENRTGVKVECQRLVYQGKNLSCNESTLKNYSIVKDSTIHLVGRLNG